MESSQSNLHDQVTIKYGTNPDKIRLKKSFKKRGKNTTSANIKYMSTLLVHTHIKRAMNLLRCLQLCGENIKEGVTAGCILIITTQPIECNGHHSCPPPRHLVNHCEQSGQHVWSESVPKQTNLNHV